MCSEAQLVAEVADFGPGEAAERFEVGAHAFEDVVEGDEAALAEARDEFVEDFPVVAGITWGWDGAVEALDASVDVDECSAFFGEASGRQDVFGVACGCVGAQGKSDEVRDFGDVLIGEAQVGEVFVQSKHQVEALFSNAYCHFVEEFAIVGDASNFCAVGVGVTVVGDEEAVGLLRAGEDVAEDGVATGHFFEEAGEVELFSGHAPGGEDGDALGRGGAEEVADAAQYIVPFAGEVSGADAGKGGFEAVFRLEGVEGEAGVVVQPALVDGFVFARSDAVNFAFARADEDVGAEAVEGVNGFGFFEEPDAHFEAEIFGGERTDGADVHSVEGIGVVETFARVDGEVGLGAALDEAEAVVVGDVFHEADAAGAEDAAFVVEDDVFANVHGFGFFVFLLDEAGAAGAVVEGVFLEFAFASLIADGAVEGVVDEEEFHDAVAAFLHEF